MKPFWLNQLPTLAALSFSVAGLLIPVSGAAQRADVSALGHVAGNPEAAVQVVEFSDFGCSACALFAREVKPGVFDEYVRTGRVGWRMVPVRLAGFRHAEIALKAAECAAAQGRFWEIAELIFRSQEEWQGSRDPGHQLAELAAAANVDSSAWEACMNERRWSDPTRQNNRAAQRSRVRGTPTSFVNGKPVIGAIGYADFVRHIEEALAEQVQ